MRLILRNFPTVGATATVLQMKQILGYFSWTAIASYESLQDCINSIVLYRVAQTTLPFYSIACNKSMRRLQNFMILGGVIKVAYFFLGHSLSCACAA